MTAAEFFTSNYKLLRPSYAPMKWMERMFTDIVSGQYPRLVDLPTGAGKTELVVVWLLALAWFGMRRSESQVVPRRLVWVVNRRVLVQQVSRISDEIRQRLMSPDTPQLDGVRSGLRSLCGDTSDFFKIVELRGQIVMDSDWAIRPATPQLIIGTVDQIGSRLLFQGYGLGKWGRPQQAGLLGVDAWVAVDEAHLVPAFVLTLRQLHERCATDTACLPAPFNAIFARLRFWLTELSATPGLPRPSKAEPFRLTEKEESDPRIADRILAAGSRLVRVVPLPPSDKPKDVLAVQLIKAAVASKASRIAIFVCEVGVADKVADGVEKEGIAPDHICKITGRIRGYERDRIAERPAFNEFLTARPEPAADTQNQRHFLVGTAAAEVGLDADADEILCDFASLPTLLQRLGRLDRRGVLSRRHADGNGEPPTMRVFATQQETRQKILAQLTTVASALKSDTNPYSAKLLAGTHWLAEETNQSEGNEDKAEDQKSASNQTDPLIEAATWKVLEPTEGLCTPPQNWLSHESARVAAGPVTVPPLTDTVLDYWSATTEERSPQLSPHPFLYGLGENDEGTPLVGVTFRLEVEALREVGSDGDDPDSPDIAAEVAEIFQRFPPLRAELHQIKLSSVRDWLTSPEAEQQPFIYRDRNRWLAKPVGESTSATIRALGPNGILILPASPFVRSKATEALLKDCQQNEARNIAISDVLDGVSKSARYRRTIAPLTERVGDDGAWLWNFDDEKEDAHIPKADLDGFKTNRPFLKRLRIGATEYCFRYFYPEHSRSSLQFLDDHDGSLGHIARAEAEARRLAETIAPDDLFLKTLLPTAARYHDEGKRFPKWQTAFGRRGSMHPIAKLHPELETPAPLHGFRHEWESLCKLITAGITPPPELSSESRALWSDLLQHLVGVHHGHLRPSITDDGLTPTMQTEKHNPLRFAAAERFARLQCQLGRWRLAYLEALLKTADAEGSRNISEDEQDGI